MAQSKYSKKRPSNGPAVSQHELDKKGRGANRAHSVGKVKTAPKVERDLLPEYDLGIFIDDMRQMSDVSLPKAKNWIVVRSYGELRELIESFSHRSSKKEPFESAFISFDHYLDETDGRRFNGQTCCDYCWMFRDQIADRIDIQGHSSDSVKNDEKLEFWYREAT
jgi:hypothetical protein